MKPRRRAVRIYAHCAVSEIKPYEVAFFVALLRYPLVDASRSEDTIFAATTISQQSPAKSSQSAVNEKRPIRLLALSVIRR